MAARKVSVQVPAGRKKGTSRKSTKKTASKKAPAKKVASKKAASKKSPSKKATSKRTSKKVTRRSGASTAQKRIASAGSGKTEKFTELELARVKHTLSGGNSGAGSKTKNLALPVAILGAVGLYLVFGQKAEAASGTPVPDTTKPAPPTAPVNPTLPTQPVLPKDPTAGLTKEQKLNRFFRRAKKAEIAPDILAMAREYTKEPMGAIHYVTSTDNGVEYAYVLEQHANLPKGDAGVSVFIKK